MDLEWDRSVSREYREEFCDIKQTNIVRNNCEYGANHLRKNGLREEFEDIDDVDTGRKRWNAV